MPVGDILEVRTVCSINPNQIAVNTTHWRVATDSFAVRTTGYQAWINAFDTAQAPLYKACMATVGYYFGCSVCRIFPTPRTRVVYSVANGGVGTVAGDVLPTQVSGLIRLRTQYAGKGYRGRVYIPFPSEASSDALGQPAAAYVTSLGAIGAFLVASRSVTSGAETLLAEHVIHHRQANKVKLPPGQFEYVTGSQAVTKWATQRRRGGLGRPNVEFAF